MPSFVPECRCFLGGDISLLGAVSLNQKRPRVPRLEIAASGSGVVRRGCVKNATGHNEDLSLFDLQMDEEWSHDAGCSSGPH